jgi:hypothetical protein
MDFKETGDGDLLQNELREDCSRYRYDWDDFRRQRRKTSFLSLVVKTLVFFLLILLCSTWMSAVLPPGFRGAGYRYLQSTFGRSGIKPNDYWTIEPGGELDKKLAEVASRVPFTLKFPTYLPGQAVLKEILFYNIDNFEVYFVFNSNLGNFTISYRDTKLSNISMALGLETIEAKEITTGLLAGIISPNIEDVNLLSLFDNRNIHILIYGQIEENELRKIANSIK